MGFMIRMKDWIGCVVCLVMGFVVCLIIGRFVIVSCCVERGFCSHYDDSYRGVADVVQEFIFRIWTKSVQRSTSLQH
jgi:hypothetical protein